jgi:hypothetical protein
MIDTLLAAAGGFEPSSTEQALTFAGSFVLAVAAVVLMWLRERR